MRIGEVCGLRWCDVDFETGLISIRHSVAYAKGMGSFIKDTKTHDARGIPIDPVGLLPFLKETHEIDCGKLRLRGLTGAVEIGDCYILSEPGATFATTSYIRRAFKTFSETNGLMGTNDELITFHGLRHTFATQLDPPRRRYQGAPIDPRPQGRHGDAQRLRRHRAHLQNP